MTIALYMEVIQASMSVHSAVRKLFLQQRSIFLVYPVQSVL